MDHRSFDTIARTLAAPASRRSVLGGLAALLIGTRAGSAQEACPIPGQVRNVRGDCRCPAGTDPCPEGCVDLKRNPDSCGVCGRSCFGGTCSRGRCVCPPGAVLCADGSCASATDPTNCGCGGERCPINETCNAGACSCQGAGSVAPYTCCPASSGGFASCTAPGEAVFKDPLTCLSVFACPEGSTPCVGVEGDPNTPYDTCQVCCPAGTTCDPLGFCRQ